MPPTTLTPAIRDEIARLGRADIMVGIPSFKNAATIGYVVRAAHAGLVQYFPDLRPVVVNSDAGSPDGTGRVATCEIMVMTGRVHDMIVDPKQTGMLSEVVAEGGYYGMQTFDQHLVSLIRDGVITLEAAMAASTSPHDLTVELRRLGLVA